MFVNYVSEKSVCSGDGYGLLPFGAFLPLFSWARASASLLCHAWTKVAGQKTKWQYLVNSDQ